MPDPGNEIIKILMIEDDPEMAEILGEYLAQEGMELENYEDPYTGISALNVNKYDLLILDLTLPGMDGLEVCRKVAGQKKIPIIISSARSDVNDQVEGLNLGADDYLPKPYDPKVLTARIRSVLRRYQDGGSEEPQSESAPSPSKLNLQEKARLISLDGQPLKLTLAEYEILAYLLRHYGQAISRDELTENIDSIDEGSSHKSIDVIVGRIRQKLGDTPKEARFIESVRGIGYRLVG